MAWAITEHRFIGPHSYRFESAACTVLDPESIPPRLR
jgi:hypothetical protein